MEADAHRSWPGTGPAIHEIAAGPGSLTDFSRGGRLGIHPHEPAERHPLCRGDRQSRAKNLGASRWRGNASNLKHDSRAWKVRSILVSNPNWEDLYDRLG